MKRPAPEQLTKTSDLKTKSPNTLSSKVNSTPTPFLPNEIKDLIVQQVLSQADLSKEDLSNLSLVEKEWNNSATIGLWTNLKIDSRERLELVIEFLKERKELGRMAKSLSIDYTRILLAELTDHRVYGPRFIWQGEPGIEPESVYQISAGLKDFDYFPNLTSLVLIQPLADTKFSSKVLLPNLKCLTYGAQPNDLELNLFRQLLVVAPRIDTVILDLTLDNSTYITDFRDRNDIYSPILICPPLKCLTISYFSDELFNSETPLFPPSSLQSLTSLALNCCVLNEESTLDFILGTKNTLKELALFTEQPGIERSPDFELYKSILPQLQVLESIDVPFIDIPAEFLQYLPQSLKFIDCTVLGAKHIHHLHANPKCLKFEAEEFSLHFHGVPEYIGYGHDLVESCDDTIECINFLPNSVKKLHLKNVVELEKLPDPSKFPSSLKELIVQLCPNIDGDEVKLRYNLYTACAITARRVERLNLQLQQSSKLRSDLVKQFGCYGIELTFELNPQHIYQ